jgi:hypothetical protein
MATDEDHCPCKQSGIPKNSDYEVSGQSDRAPERVKSQIASHAPEDANKRYGIKQRCEQTQSKINGCVGSDPGVLRNSVFWIFMFSRNEFDATVTIISQPVVDQVFA